MSQQLLMDPVIDWPAKEAAALAAIDDAVQQHGPNAVIACVSGGLDSIVMARIARKHPAVQKALRIDTQTGVTEGAEWTDAALESMGYDVMVRRSPVRFFDVVRAYGILGRGHHQTYFNAPKGRVFQAVAVEHAPTTDERVVYLPGARKKESKNRKKNVKPVRAKKEAIKVAGLDGKVKTVRQDTVEPRIVWASPIHDWSKLETRMYLRREGMEENPVSQRLHRSGECNCPAYLTLEEIEELRFWYPDAARVIEEAQRIAKEAGKWDQYGVPVPDWFDTPDVGALDEWLDGPTCEPEACNDCPMRTTEEVPDDA